MVARNWCGVGAGKNIKFSTNGTPPRGPCPLPPLFLTPHCVFDLRFRRENGTKCMIVSGLGAFLKRA